MLDGVHPLARIVAGLLLNHIDPVRLNSRPLTVDVVASLILDRRQTVRLHIAGKKLLAILRDPRLKHEDTCSHAHTEEQVLRQLNDLTQAVTLQNPLHLCLRCLLQFLIRQDKRALRVRRNAIQHVLDDGHATVPVLIRRVHQHFCNRLGPHPLAGRIRASIHLLKIRLAVLVNQHVRARQRVNLAVELDAVELLRLNRAGLLRLHATSLANHVRHCLHEETAGTACSIQNAVIHVHFENLVHEVRDVLGREYLPRLGLLLVTVELIEEDTHHVLAAPFVRVDALGNLDNPVDKVVDCLLIVGRVHLDVGILFQQDVNLCVLLTAIL